MKNLQDLFVAEFKNLYAIEKQILETFGNIEHIEHSKLKQRIDQIMEASEKDFEVIQKLLKNMELNPGNTVDSVAEQILTNIISIDSQDLSPLLKDAAIMPSLIRLSYYKTANYNTARRLAQSLEIRKVEKKLKKMIKNAQKSTKKLEKLTKDDLFEKAK